MSKTIIPFGNRLLVKRRVVGDKIGKENIIYAPDSTAEGKTDIADVVYIPEHSFADAELIKNGNSIVNSLIGHAKEGQANALEALLKFNMFLKIKSIKVGDVVMISKYVGMTFSDNRGNENLTVLDGDDIICIVVDDK